jgi:RimJ/RimL family protein N-acetyltransferase
MSAPHPRSAFPRALATERLALRAAENGDAPLYARLLHEAYATRGADAVTPAQADAFGTFALEHWARYGFGFLLLSDRSGDTLGHCGLRYAGASPRQWATSFDDIEIGYALIPAARGAGYASEAARAVLEAAFAAFDVAQVIGRCSFDNEASARVLLRCGMHEIEPETTLRRFAIRSPRTTA